MTASSFSRDNGGINIIIRGSLTIIVVTTTILTNMGARGTTTSTGGVITSVTKAIELSSPKESI